jgi:hypothetical protein
LNPTTPSPDEPVPAKPRSKLLRVLLICTLLVVFAAISFPSFGGPPPNFQRTKFLSQMKGIFPAMKMYARDHGGKFPARLSELEPDYLDSTYLSKIFYAESKSGNRIEPIYFPGYTEATPHATILIGSPLAIGKKRFVVRADGSAQLFFDTEYQALLKQQPPREW